MVIERWAQFGPSVQQSAPPPERKKTLDAALYQERHFLPSAAVRSEGAGAVEFLTPDHRLKRSLGGHPFSETVQTGTSAELVLARVLSRATQKLSCFGECREHMASDRPVQAGAFVECTLVGPAATRPWRRSSCSLRKKPQASLHSSLHYHLSSAFTSV